MEAPRAPSIRPLLVWTPCRNASISKGEEPVIGASGIDPLIDVPHRRDVIYQNNYMDSYRTPSPRQRDVDLSAPHEHPTYCNAAIQGMTMPNYAIGSALFNDAGLNIDAITAFRISMKRGKYPSKHVDHSGHISVEECHTNHETVHCDLKEDDDRQSIMGKNQSKTPTAYKDWDKTITTSSILGLEKPDKDVYVWSKLNGNSANTESNIIIGAETNHHLGMVSDDINMFDVSNNGRHSDSGNSYSDVKPRSSNTFTRNKRYDETYRWGICKPVPCHDCIHGKGGGAHNHMNPFNILLKYLEQKRNEIKSYFRYYI